MSVDSFACVTVAEVAARTRNALVGGPFGSDLVAKDYVSSGVPVIRGTNMGHGRWVAGDFAYVTEAKANSLLSNCAKPGDLVFTQRGTLGQVALVPPNAADRYLISQSQMKVTLDCTKADPLFIYYVFTGSEQQAYIQQNAITTGVPHTNLGILRNTPLTLPSLADQKAIASVLGALDDKIELNRRMNATLEATARALFRSWFVDFDPVRAKLDGREPVGLDTQTAALFPDSFEESTLGQIPRGWEVGSILRQAELLSGGTPKTDVPAYWNGDVLWASAKDVSQCGDAFLLATERTITAQGVDRSATKLLPSLTTVVVARGATTGRLTMLSCEMAMNQTCYGLRSKVGAAYALYFNARHFMDRLVKSGHGSIFDTITTSTFESTAVVLAPSAVLRAFDARAAPILALVLHNLRQSRTLSTMRDALLPILLSGELKLSPSTFASNE